MKTEYEVMQHFVTFYSPGTFVAETSTKPIKSWDTKVACAMARKIHERHGATPYGFVFTTNGRKKGALDSREIKRSCTYYLGGQVFTLADVVKRNDPNDKILISNMKGNGYKRIIQNDNSWRWTQPLDDDDIVLPFKPTHAVAKTK